MSTVPISDDAAVEPRRRPDFFVVGQPKSGTTALYEMLRQHPQIYMPDLKEPEFFAADLRRRAPRDVGGVSRPLSPGGTWAGAR